MQALADGPSEDEREVYDAALISTSSLDAFNASFHEDLMGYASGPQCYRQHTGVPDGYPNMCAIGGAENTRSKSSASQESVRTRRMNNLRSMCNNDTSRANAQELRRQRDMENTYLQADRNLTQREENEFTMAIAGDPNFQRALQNLTGAQPDVSMGLCLGNARQNVDFAHGRYDTGTFPSHRSDSQTIDRIFRECSEVVPMHPLTPSCDEYNVTITEDNVRSKFECRRSITFSEPMRDVSFCRMLSPPRGGSIQECLRLEEESYQRTVNQFWTRQIPICQAHLQSLKSKCEASNLAAQQAYDATIADRATRRAACGDRIRAEVAQQRAAAQVAEDEAYTRDLAAREQSDCYAPAATANKQALCAGGRAISQLPECAGITNHYDLNAEKQYPVGDPHHPMANSHVQNASAVRNMVNIFRSNFNNVFDPEHRMENCLTRIGFQSICDQLNQRLQRDNQRLSEIYTPDKMSKAEDLGNRIKEQYRASLQRLLPGSSNRAKRQTLLDRIDKISFVRPEGNEALTGASDGYAVCYCHPGRVEATASASSDFRECAKNTVVLSPAMMLNLNSPGGEERLKSVMMHEIGHSVAPDLSESDPIFGSLASCLGPKVNLASFPTSENQKVKKEAVADWLAAEVMGDMLQSSTPDRAGRPLALANQMDNLMCSVLGDEINDDRINCHYDENGQYRYYDQLSYDSAESATYFEYGGQRYYCNKSSFNHPLPQDRLAIFARSAGIRRALGCPAPSSSGTRVQSCSL